MEGKSIRLKKVALLAGALCAYWIGSGFTTGQEVLQFFASSGIKGIIAAVIFLVIISYFTCTFFIIGQKKNFANPYDVYEYYFGKVLGQAYIWFTVIVTYVISVIMLAGAGATINQYFGVSAYIGTGAIALLALGTALLGVNKLIDIIGVIGPVKIIFVTLVGITGIICVIKQPALLSEASRIIPMSGVKTATSNWAWSGVIYAFLVLSVSIPFEVTCGASTKNAKEAKTSAIVATVTYTTIIILLTIAELAYYKLIIGQQVPTLAIAKNISPILGLVFSVLIVLSIYSAVASYLWMTVRKFAKDRTKKFNIVAIALTVIAMFFGGILPFDKLVNILYPIAGYVSIVFAVILVYKQIRGKIVKWNSCKTKNLKDSIIVKQ